MFDESETLLNVISGMLVSELSSNTHTRLNLAPEDVCCTGRMTAAQGGWVLHREDGCCTEKIGAAQGGRVLHSSRSREAPQRDTRWTKKVQTTAKHNFV